jgi:hypothetical protein
MGEQPVAIQITEFPQIDTGAPTPLVLADEHRVVLSYLLREFPNDHLSAIVSFENAWTHLLGSPGDETRHGHPLWQYGLKHYGAFRIENSPLIHELQRIDSVHPHHKPEKFRLLTHFFIAFHDSTFECVAKSFVITTSAAYSDQDRLACMIESLSAKGATT